VLPPCPPAAERVLARRTRPPALAGAGLVACVFAAWALPALAAPDIEVAPRAIALPTVTLGDTAEASIHILNAGDETLAITGFETPGGVILEPGRAIEVAPDSSLKVSVLYAPADTSRTPLVVTVRSNDPLEPAVTVTLEPDVLPLLVDSNALTLPGAHPIGEAIVVQAVPLPGVRIETATLFYRSGSMLIFSEQPMVSNGRTFIGIVPGDFVMENGVHFYVVVANSRFTASDPVEGEARPRHVAVGSPSQFELEPRVRNPGAGFRAGESIDFNLFQQRGTVFEHGTLHYRRGGDSLYQTTEIREISFTGVAATIPADWAGERGVQWWAEITTATTRLTDPPVDPETRPYELRITVDHLAEPDLQPAARYRMVSIPLEMPPGTNLATLLADQPEFGLYDTERWRAFRWLPDLNAHVELSDPHPDAFMVAPGKAFWLISRLPHTVDISPAPGVSTSASDPFTMTLAPGWNQIGNPYAFPLARRALRAGGALGAPVRFDPEINDYAEETPTVLAPFDGWFVENVTAEPVQVTVLPIADTTAADTAGARAAVRRAAASHEPWAFGARVEARTAAGATRGHRVGLAAAARDARDDLDRAEPPPAPGAVVRLAIAHPDGRMRHDARSTTGEGQTWELEVASAAAGEAIELTLRAEGALPAGWIARLVDREQGVQVVLDPSAASWRHTLVSLGPSRAYRLAFVAGTPDHLDRAAEAHAPERLTLDHASPNPARDAQRLRFGLPRAAPVRLEVFDAGGRRVATLIDGRTLEAGFHTAVWQPARDGAGRVSSGLYFHRLTAGGETRTVRAVLVR
jgi:hypothetical protein